ncbi:hypothetical protein GH714_030498 [Hevea brasiliensis]|uniref:Uncharacterized protein n=1 Tax=Hevea brasiliensis TaxID=3981 RepID=A0A6A6N963_HEVBR|nr:hypothetical protein GH714_030498 [Hevea brasiliensis]
MELVELTSLREALGGLLGVNGLSIEQRKRMTIAIEQASGLDVRAAAIVMTYENSEPIVAIERIAFYIERAAGMYSVLPYAFEQVVIELPIFISN